MIPASIVIAVSSALTTLALVAVFAAGWYFARYAVARHPAGPVGQEEQPAADRIGLADLRARVRRLEAVAAGIDL